ncbi:MULTISPECIES: DUF4194 domain-containing protein [Rhodanobacter]|jgi:hypothetical protein|uniref:DUF4194 domain-containing protein n=1 Tax=Rhodanobacter glycinis TaxID=582702 RepID=A0A1I3ZYV2_9GAMM|nr:MULTISPECIES: DUF4194 domain-containing protein [Rhodanobacter]EIL91710.1 hypothetical protein UU5_14048 [Rhodanobacter sp. 115]SFK49110.1 protein of unknown function [Rhodanobacter glycinis]
MKRSWNTLSQISNGVYAVQDFERAAYRLVTEQVLYASDRNARTAYHLIEDHFDDYLAVLEPLGIRLERNAHYRYVVALPTHGEGTPVTLDETLLLLVLRQRYDEAMRQGQIEDQGEVVVELPDLQEAYPALAGRAMPEVGTLRTLVRTLKRWGVCRLVDTEGDDPQPFHLRVRPAIVEIVGEQWLQRLDQHNRDDDIPDEARDDADTDTDVTEDDDAAA